MAEMNSLSSWIWSFAVSGKMALVRVSCFAARIALPVWESHIDTDPQIRRLLRDAPLVEALDAVELWIAAPEEKNRQATEQLEAALLEALHMLEIAIDEASGNASMVEARIRALEAGQASYYATAAAAWSASRIDVNGLDPGEVKAQLGTGPAFETVQAVLSAKRALAIMKDEMMREKFIAAGLIP